MKIYDADIRKILFKSFLEKKEYMEEKDTVIISELDVCAGVSRADVAVINGKIHGYEIKSKQDNLERLPQQIDSYNRVFNTMTIVTYESHLTKVRELVPKWWEIKCIVEKKGHIILRNIRKGKENSNINIQNVAMLLWKDEMIDLLLNHSNIVSGYKSKSRYELSRMIQKHVEGYIVQEYVRSALKTRKEWKAVPIQHLNDDLHNKLPS